MVTPDDLSNLPPDNDPAPDPHRSNATLGLALYLLDPRGLNALMLAGGILLSLGLVIWLAVIGLFENPVVAATALGTANLGLLGASVGVAAKTRYRTAGRGAALLGCLLLPLNLWFYDSQGLITLADGGNLWLPALACCAIYAAVARYLRDPLFVYAFTGGVTLTGLLFLADGDVGRFWEVLAPSTLLVTLGIGCLHVERLFPAKDETTSEDAFTRENFGLAFFRAGHALLASGLAVLLAGRLVGRYYTAVFDDLGWFVQPDVVTLFNVKLAVVGLLLAALYAYVYSHVVRGGERFVVMATLTAGWAALVVLEIMGVGVVGSLLALTAAGSAAVVAGRSSGLAAVARAGRVAVVLGGAAGALFAANRVLGGDANGLLLAFTAGQTAIMAVTTAFTRRDEGRNGLVALTILLGLASGAVMNVVSPLTLPQKFEVFATLAGLGLVGAGLVGRHRESDEAPRGESLVGANLWIGSLLATVPITIGLLGTRLGSGAPWWEAAHELGVLAIGLALVGVGVLGRLRATTLCGAGALTVYVLSLVLLIDVPDELQNVAVYLMAGGGLVFGGAVLLSVYRDRLLALPEKASRGEGVFAVLKWR